MHVSSTCSYSCILALDVNNNIKKKQTSKLQDKKKHTEKGRSVQNLICVFKVSARSLIRAHLAVTKFSS